MPTHKVSNDGQEMPASSPTGLADEDMSARKSSNDDQESAASSSSSSDDAEYMSMQEGSTQPAAAASASRRTQPAKTFFGMVHDSQKQKSRANAFKDDYLAQFPVDPYGQETAPNARAWRVYVEEAAIFDENMVGQSRDGLDVMLVFAGLFSAVVTSFLVQVSQNLQADFSEMSALLLHDLLIVQLAMVDGATVNVTAPSVNPAAQFKPDAINAWINGLWLVSLITSLVVALAAVLVKQWLHHYMTFPSGTPELRSHIRQYRFMGLEKWRLRIIIGMLPIIMHISLMLFFVGLALFYIPLHTSLAWAVGTITVLVCVLYLVSNGIPIIFPECPYQTPLTDFIHHVCHVVLFGVHSIQHYCVVTFRGIRKQPAISQQQSSVAPESESVQSNFKLLTQLESDTVKAAHTTLSINALDWLYHMSLNPTVQTIVLQGISGLPEKSRSYAMTKWSGATDMQIQRCQLLKEASQRLDISDQLLWVAERLCRSSLFLPISNESQFLESSWESWELKFLWYWAVALQHSNGHRDPRIKAALHLVDKRGFDYWDFFASHSKVLMPSLVWDKIVSVIVPSSTDLILTTSCIESLMTGPQVIWMGYNSQFWDKIIQTDILALHDIVYDIVLSTPMPSYFRTLVAAGKLALSTLQRDHLDINNLSVKQQHHLELLARVVMVMLINEKNELYWTLYLSFLICVLKEFQDVTFSSIESTNSDFSFISKFSPADIRLYYLESSSEPDFPFTDLDCFLQTWAGFYNCTQYDPVFTWDRPLDLEMPITVMARALSCGHKEAYQIFTDRGWMGILFTEWAICGDALHRVITHYIEGLFTITSVPNRHQCCQYLHQPQQLILAAMLLIVTNQSVDQLVKICPTHTSWSDCLTALEAIRKWGQTPNPAVALQFPWPLSLQSLKNTEAFHKYPLVEWTARRFAEPDMQQKLQLALEALHKVLDNAKNVDGVLMPDLENQPEHALDAASAPESEGVGVALDVDQHTADM